MNIKNISPGVYLKPNIPTLNLLNTYILVFKKVKISSIFDRNLKIGTMKHILLFIMLTTITACLLTSCKSKTTQSATSQSQMSQSQILEVDDILARADSLTGKTFTTEALCTHICAHGGGKIFLMPLYLPSHARGQGQHHQPNDGVDLPKQQSPQHCGVGSV